MSAVLIRDLWQWTPASQDERAGLVIAIVVTLAGAATILNHTQTSYYFSPGFIERRPLMPFLRRRLAVENIDEGYLVPVRGGYTLKLVGADGRSLAIPLEGKLRSDVAAYYSELGDDPWQAAVVPSRYRWVLYAILALAMAAFIAAVIITTR